ncbi:MAG: hypothetical protein KKE71_02845, partial [Nanoarchaeota archaeon]|nr:hypothetical protein [Nanoarchaeota archaeon]
MADENSKAAAEDAANAVGRKPESPRVRPVYFVIAVVVFGLVIGMISIGEKSDMPTGKVLEPVAPSIFPEQIAEFNTVVAECNQYIAERDNNNTIDCLRKADAIKTDLKVVS